MKNKITTIKQIENALVNYCSDINSSKEKAHDVILYTCQRIVDGKDPIEAIDMWMLKVYTGLEYQDILDIFNIDYSRTYCNFTWTDKYPTN